MARIYAIRLSRHGVRAVRPDDLAACRITHADPTAGHSTRPGYLHNDRRAFLRWAGLSAAAPIAVLAVMVLTSSATVNKIVLAVFLAALNGGMLGAADLAWGYALQNSAKIDALLGAATIGSSPPEPRAAWIVSPIATGIRFQALMPTCFAVISPAVLLAHAGDHDWITATNVTMALGLSWSGFLLGNVSWWLFVPPFIVFRMQTVDNLLLRWNDPARTPGVRTFSEGYAAAAILLSLGAVGVSLPSLFGLAIFGSVQPYAYVWLVILSLSVGIGPQLSLYRIIRAYKLHILDQLAEDSRAWTLPSHSKVDIGDRLRAHPDLRTELDSYNDVAVAPTLPFGTPAGVQYAAALIGSLIAFVLQ